MSKIAIIVLAAGAGTRMKQVKQLLPYKKTTLLGHALEIGLNTKAHHVVCVLGAHASEIQKKVDFSRVFVTINSDWSSGMGSSINAGVAYAEKQMADLDAVLITLADQPFVSSAYLDNIITQAQHYPGNIIASTYKTSVGVPALFPKFYFEALKALKGKQGAKNLLETHHKDVVPLQPDFRNMDIDTLEDYKNII